MKIKIIMFCEEKKCEVKGEGGIKIGAGWFFLVEVISTFLASGVEPFP